ncbi:MAG: DUF3703 domain-containing protein [Myxococcales bacterium]|nr:DUF3703 domain-containing protein [Myxococcales bacterium]
MASLRRKLRPFVERELAASAAARRTDRAGAWTALGRAHILSQPPAWLHTHVHWRMLTLAMRHVDLREAMGQVIRLAVARIGSAAGRFPAGNTGRARVALVANGPMPEDIAVIFAQLDIVVAGTTVAGGRAGGRSGRLG